MDEMKDDDEVIHVFCNNLPPNYNKESCINDAKAKRDYILYLEECIRKDVIKASGIMNDEDEEAKVKKENELKSAMVCIKHMY